MDRVAETQDAGRFTTAISTMAISFAGAALRDLVHPPFRVMYWCDIEQVIVRVWKRQDVNNNV